MSIVSVTAELAVVAVGVLPATAFAVPGGGDAVGFPIINPPDALCVEFDRGDRARWLNSIMLGEHGPIGEWQSGDGAAMIQLGPEQWIFLLGDSTVGPNDGVVAPATGFRFIHNSVLVHDGDCVWGIWRGKDRAAPAQSLFLAPGHSYYWLSDGYLHDGTLYLGVNQVRDDPTSWFGFEVFDHDMVVVDVALGLRGSRQFERAARIESGPWDATPLGRLNGHFLDADSSLFQFRTDLAAYPGAYVAQLTDLSDPSRPWRWWDGRGWNTDPLTVVDIAPALEPGDNRVIGPFAHDGSWYAMSSSMEHGRFVFIPMQAPALFGPWRVVDRVPAIPIAGRAAVQFQYGHALQGTYVTGEHRVLMRWSNNEGPRPLPLALQRPSFVTFDLQTMTVM